VRSGRGAAGSRTHVITTFSYEDGHPSPYVVVVESPSGEIRTYRWASAAERQEAVTNLPLRLAARNHAAEGPPDVEPRAQTAPIAPVEAAAVAGRSLPGRAVIVTAALVTCAVAPVLVALGAPAVVRVPGVLLFLCLVPGSALLALLVPRHVPLELGLVVMTSLAIATLTAQSMLWLDVWAPDAFLNGLVVASITALAVSLLRERTDAR
jgi:hypothetical protein